MPTATSADILLASYTELMAALRDQDSDLHTKFTQLVKDASIGARSVDTGPVYEFTFVPGANELALTQSDQPYVHVMGGVVLLTRSAQLGMKGWINDEKLSGFVALTPQQFLAHTLFDGSNHAIDRLHVTIVALEQLKEEHGH